MTIGRPPKWIISPKYIDEICARIIAGQSLVTISNIEHLPEITTMLRWLAREDPTATHPETGQNLYEMFRVEYGRARTASAEVGLEQIAEIERRLLLNARIPNPDWDAAKGRAADNPKTIMAEGGIDPHTARVLVDSIKWRMGKLNGKYSEKTQLELSGTLGHKAVQEHAPDWLKDKVAKAVPVVAAPATAAPQHPPDEETVH